MLPGRDKRGINICWWVSLTQILHFLVWFLPSPLCRPITKPTMKMYTRSIAIFVLGSCILGACAADAGHGRKLKGCLDPTGFFCSNESTCPPQGFDAVQDLDVDKYVSAPWYIQEQVQCRRHAILVFWGC